MNGSSGSAGTLLARAGKFSSATLISRVLGYLRDASVAYFFGGSGVTDVFYTAFRASNLFRRLLGEGALASAFVPVFSRVLKDESRPEVQRFLSALTASLCAVLAAVTLGGMVFAPQITRLIAPGFSADPEKFALTVKLTRWIFPFFFFISLAALLSGVLNSLKRFFLPAVSPAMLSVAEIGYLFIFMRHYPPDAQIVGLAVAVVAGGALHFLVQVPALFKEGFSLKLLWEWRHPRSVEVGRLMIPAVIGLSVDQVNAFVDTICATFLAEGSVTALYNSNRLMQLPLALFGIAVATASLPTLSEHSAEKDRGVFGRTLGDSLSMVLFSVTPAAVGLLVLGRPIVKLLFEHGRFTSFATDLTTRALWGYALGLVAYSAVKVLANAFYAIREPGVPVRAAAFCMTVNVALNLVLMGPFGVGGLALATAVSSWLNAAILFRFLARRLGKGAFDFSRVAETGAKSAASALAMAAVVWGLTRWAGGLGTLGAVALGIGAGVPAYLACARLLNVRELKTALSMFGPGGNIDD